RNVTRGKLRRFFVTGSEDNIEFILRSAQPAPSPLFKSSLGGVQSYTQPIEGPGGPQILRQSLDHPADNRFSCFSPIAKDHLVSQGGHIRRMSDNAIERATF